METTALSPTPALQSIARSPETTRATGAEGKSIASDFETFLQMLTVQMQNQDPLNPMEASEFASQLATFSSVEQQTRTNQLLQSMSDRMGLGALSQTAGWVGMEALVDAPIKYDATPVDLVIEPGTAAERADLVVKEASGRVVGRLPIDADATRITWEGTTAAGPVLPGALYSFAVESYANGEMIETRPVRGYAAVQEVRAGGDGAAQIVLDGGRAVAASEVRALRTPIG